MFARPERLVAVAGTATEIGKTWVAAQLLAELRRRGLTVAARKPVQSFDPSDGAPTDAEVLGAASGEPPHQVCPPHRSLPVPLAPPMAAARLGREPVLVADLEAELRWTSGIAVGLVETVGGVLSPIADDGHSADLIRRVAPDLVLLVADAELGTINSVRLSAMALDGLHLHVVLNRYDPSHRLHVENLAWLRNRDGLAVTAATASGWVDDLRILQT